MAIQYYGSRISDNISKLPNGYLVCHDTPIARTGYQDYNPEELIKDADALREYGSSDPISVYRDPAEVFSPATMASFESMPITEGHPRESVTADNYGSYEIGHVQNVRKGPVLASGECALIADLVIKDANVISRIEAGERPEVSCGYNHETGPDETGLWRQKNIRGNHVALVAKGRAGSDIAIHDHARPSKEPSMANTKTTSLWGKMMKTFAAVATDSEMEEAAKLREEEASDATPEQEANNNPLDERFKAMDERLKKIEDCIKDKAKDAEPAAPKVESEAEAEDEDTITPEEEEEESASDAEPSGESLIPVSERPENPIPGADAALAQLRSMKPLIAKSGNKMLIDSWMKSVRALKPAKAVTGDGYKALSKKINTARDQAPSTAVTAEANRKAIEDSGAAKRAAFGPKKA